MKNLKVLLLGVLAMVSLQSCNDDELGFSEEGAVEIRVQKGEEASIEFTPDLSLKDNYQVVYAYFTNCNSNVQYFIEEEEVYCEKRLNEGFYNNPVEADFNPYTVKVKSDTPGRYLLVHQMNYYSDDRNYQENVFKELKYLLIVE